MEAFLVLKICGTTIDTYPKMGSPNVGAYSPDSWNRYRRKKLPIILIIESKNL